MKRSGMPPLVALAAAIGSLILLWPGSLWAAVTVELTVEENRVAVGDEVPLEVTVRGVRGAPRPEIDGLDPFEIRSLGTGTRIEIRNGTADMATTFRYGLTARRSGKYTVGPARVTVNGTGAVSRAVVLEVGRAGVVAQANRPFRLEAALSAPKAYVNERLVYTLRFLSRGELRGANLDLPDFGGFLREAIGEPERGERIVNGERWRVTQWRYALYPTESGSREIPAARLQGQWLADDVRFGFFGGLDLRPVQVLSPGVAVEVLPWPSPRPEDFTGLVGDFRIGASLSRARAAVGDSVTLTVRLEGEGNLGDGNPEVPAVAGFKIYPDRPVVDGGVKTFKWALVPLEPGEKRIAPLSLSYLEPRSGSYRTLRTPELKLVVLPAPSAPATAAPPRAAEENAVPWGLVAAALGVLGMMAAALAAFLRKGRAEDPVRRRQARAAELFRRRLAHLDREGIDGLSHGLRDYLGDKLGVDGRALTPGDLERHLGPAGVSETLRREAEAVLGACEAGRYGGLGDPSVLGERAASLVEGLEKEISPG